MLTKLITRLRAFSAEWQDALFWIPLAILLLVAITIVLPMLDPRAGVDGLGFLQGYAALLLKGVLGTFMAWLCKRTYTQDLGEDRERDLLMSAQDGRWQPLAIDRIEWAAWLAFWFVVLSS